MIKQNAHAKNAMPAGHRAQIVENALRHLPDQATAQDRKSAIDAARAAIQDSLDASEALEGANLAVKCLAEDVRRRLRREHWRAHAPDLLPYGADADEKREAVELALERLEELPPGMSDYEVKEQISGALRSLCEDIEADQKIERLVEHGRKYIDDVLRGLYLKDLLTSEDRNDPDLRNDLEEELAAEMVDMDGSESHDEIEELVRRVVEDCLEEWGYLIEEGEGD